MTGGGRALAPDGWGISVPRLLLISHNRSHVPIVQSNLALIILLY